MARRAKEGRDIHGVKKTTTAEDCKRGRKVELCRRWKEWQGEQKKSKEGRDVHGVVFF